MPLAVSEDCGLVWWRRWGIAGARALLGDAYVDIFAVAWEFRGLGRPRLRETCIELLVQRYFVFANSFAFYIALHPYAITLAARSFLTAVISRPWRWHFRYEHTTYD